VKIQQLSYKVDAGWSCDAFPCLDSKHTLIIAFGASEFIDKKDVFEDLKKAYPKSQLVGCSTSGEISSEGVNDESLTVAVVQFEKTKFKVVSESIQSADASFATGVALGEQIDKKDLKSLLVFSGGINVNGTELVKGLRLCVGDNVIITGGLAGDGTRFEKTWVLNNEVADDQIAVVAFYGDHLEINYGTEGGWDCFGPERVVTKSEGNVVYEIDRQPALALYKQYLGDHARDLPASALLFPLGIKSSINGEPIVRTILSVDEENNSMTFAGDVPQGWHAHFMRANFETLIDGAHHAALQLGEAGQHKSNEDDPLLAIAISCVGRRIVLGEYTDDEIDAVMEVLPKHTHLLGYYSYGEISPSPIKNCELHNQTMTLTTFRERL
jgi:hypothetical protein